MSFLRLTLACLIMVLLVAGCEEGDEADFQEFVPTLSRCKTRKNLLPSAE
jgi:hypothetical protein